MSDWTEDEPTETLRVSLDPRSAVAILIGVLGLLIVFALGRSTAPAP